MGLMEDQEHARTACERLVNSFPTNFLSREANIATRLAQAKIAPLKKLDAIYQFLDDISNYVAPSTPCKKGCSNCCHYAVTVSEVEIQYIEKNSKQKRLKTTLPKADFHGQPCPFLKNNACSIYSARPFVCRRFHSLAPSPEWCAPENSFAGEFPQVKSSEAEAAFNALRTGSPVLDIRQVFGAA